MTKEELKTLLCYVDSILDKTRHNAEYDSIYKKTLILRDEIYNKIIKTIDK